VKHNNVSDDATEVLKKSNKRTTVEGFFELRRTGCMLDGDGGKKKSLQYYDREQLSSVRRVVA
jgi:hypothetical protein